MLIFGEISFLPTIHPTYIGIGNAPLVLDLDQLLVGVKHPDMSEPPCGLGVMKNCSSRGSSHHHRIGSFDKAFWDKATPLRILANMGQKSLHAFLSLESGIEVSQQDRRPSNEWHRHNGLQFSQSGLVQTRHKCLER